MNVIQSVKKYVANALDFTDYTTDAGAMDIVLVQDLETEDRDSEIQSSAFHVRFDKIQTPPEQQHTHETKHVVRVVLNGQDVPDLTMTLGLHGEAFFVREKGATNDDVDELRLNPDDDDERQERKLSWGWAHDPLLVHPPPSPSLEAPVVVDNDLMSSASRNPSLYFDAMDGSHTGSLLSSGVVASQGPTSPAMNDIQMSCCRNEIALATSEVEARRIFEDFRISAEAFREQALVYLMDPNVLFMIQEKLYPVEIASIHLILSQVFHESPGASDLEDYLDTLIDTESGPAASGVDGRQRRSWLGWLKTNEDTTNHSPEEGIHEPPTDFTSNDNPQHSFVPTVSQLQTLKPFLHQGQNQIEFHIHSRGLGHPSVMSNLFVFSPSVKLIVTDLQLDAPLADDKPSPMRVFYQTLEKHGYQVMYIGKTSRKVIMDLPKGPCFTSPKILDPTFRPSVLQTLRALFPGKGQCPFVAGFGHSQDMRQVYAEAGIPEGKIFIDAAYDHMNTLVQVMFPSIVHQSERDPEERFNAVNFWKLPHMAVGEDE